MKSPKAWAVLALLCYCSTGSPAWAYQQEQDRVELDELTIYGLSYEHYAQGLLHTRIAPDSLQPRSLSQVLRDEAGVHLTEYGAPGQLASINLRGLGSSRTSLLWNGLEINSFTLGSTDYALLQTGGTQLSVTEGAATSLLGNGAIGGTVSMQSAPVTAHHKSLQLSQEIGSFGHQRQTLELQAAGQKWSQRLHGLHVKADNDFPYQLGDSTVRQRNAAYQLYALSHDLHFRGTSPLSFSLHSWYQHNWRELQGARTNLNASDVLQDQHLRLLGQVLYSGINTSHQLKLGYTVDDQEYNEDDPITTHRIFVSWETEVTRYRNLLIKAGANYNRLRAIVPSYASAITEHRNDLYLSLLYQASPRLKIGVNARQPVINGLARAFTPSLFAERRLSQNERLELSWRVQLNRSYRLPTLNDRYWNPGGNLDLVAETGYGLDNSLALILKNDKLQSTTTLNYYYQLVDNWIIWIPGGSGTDEEGNPISFWFPDNVRSVRAQGLGLRQELSWSAGNQWSLSLLLSGRYTSTINREALNRFDRSVNKQLPYTPKWMGSLNLRASKGQLRLWLNNRYTGSQFVETNNERAPLRAFWLSNLGVQQGFTLGSLPAALSMEVRNLLNTNYENFENRAMPGINYRLSLHITPQF